MNETREIEVRHPYVGEVPPELMKGFEVCKIDPEWQWVLVLDGSVVAQMLCVNAHGMLMILRITALPEAPHGWAVAMFRKVFSECQNLNLIGYEAFLADNRPAEVKMMKIAQRAGAYLVPSSGVWVAGRLDMGY